MLSRINVEQTKKVLRELHDNYNQIFKVGDLLPTEVLGKLICEIFREDYYLCNKHNKNNGKGHKKRINIIKFFFFASKFNNLNYSKEEIKKIDLEASKNCTTPIKLLKLFKMSVDDIIYYLEENFFYSGYRRFGDVWEMLSNNGHNKNRKSANKYHKLFIKFKHK